MSEPAVFALPPKDGYDYKDDYDDDGATSITLRPEDAIDERLERLQLKASPAHAPAPAHAPVPSPTHIPLSAPPTSPPPLPKTSPSFSITAVTREQDHIHNFTIDTYGYVQEAHWQPAFSDGFHGWFQRGDVKFPPNGHVTAVSPAPGHIHLFATDVSGRIVGCRAAPARNLEGETWTAWEQIADGVAPPGAYVAAVVWKEAGRSQIEVFVCREDGQVWSNAFGRGRNAMTVEERWLGPWVCMRSENFRGVPGCPISAVARLDGHLDVFLADVEGRVMTTARGVDTNGWLNWWYFGINATPGAPVTAIVEHANCLDIFVVDANGIACNAWWDGAHPKPGWNWWNGPNEIVPSTKFVPGSWLVVVTRSDRQIDLFAVDKDGRFVNAARHQRANWWGWAHVNGEYGHPGAPMAACVRRLDHLDIAGVRRSDEKVVAAAWNPCNVNWFAGWWQLRDLKVY
ncbi:fucose-specific lectin [Zopfia rhizophila CBS 207.26]|uniref:Fucose-specific lectin n=1 Tax=Zopfia rhizophila CBS 207.26 TaxID=1314779 RepID=A0A6A6DMK5_9PEZI|nr:fucose-specific lectin [Zopfia rhizophila CBS 207.26]